MLSLYIRNDIIEMNKDILQRYVEGNVTSEEVEAVVDWLDADEKHVKELMSLHVI